MSRHNRRRTRGGRKHSAARSVASSDSSIDNFESGNVALISAFQAPVDPVALGSVVPDVIYRMPATPQRMPLARSSTVSARAWHNRYMAWQNRDRKQREEMSRLEAERARIFGGPNWGGGGGGGDDGADGFGEDDSDGLEEKMLEYFGGLEWLDT